MAWMRVIPGRLECYSEETISRHGKNRFENSIAYLFRIVVPVERLRCQLCSPSPPCPVERRGHGWPQQPAIEAGKARRDRCGGFTGTRFQPAAAYRPEFIVLVDFAGAPPGS